MANAQRIAAGFPFPVYVNETATKQRIAPGVYVNETIAAGGNVPTNITLAQASWLWTGRALTVDAKTMITLAQGAWSWAGQAASMNIKTMTTLAQATWRWTGIPIGGLVTGAVNYLLGLMGVGL